MQFLKLTLLLFIFILLSCKDNLTSHIDYIEDDYYPLKIGNEWIYKRSISYNNFEPDSLKDMFSDYKFYVNVKVTRKTVLDSINLFELFETNDLFNSSYAYYANQPNGLYKYAYSNSPSYALPKRINSVQLKLDQLSFTNSFELLNFLKNGIVNSVNNDSVMVFDQPRLVYKYPMTIGSEWNFTSDFLIIDKKIIGHEIIVINSNSYNCIKIMWDYKSQDFSNTIEYYEWVCEKGLIKSSVTIKDVTISTIEFPDGFGKVDYKEENILTEINF